MDAKDILDLAQQIAKLDIPGTIRCAARVADVANHIQRISGEAPGDTSRFEAELESLGKGAWWSPGHNLAIHRGKEAWSFWSFTLLPSFATKRAYRDDLGGIVIRPTWRLAADRQALEMASKTASTLIENMRAWPTLKETIHREVSWINDTFGVRIPDIITTKLVEGVDEQAQRRWGVNRLRVPERLIPLDGAAPRDLGAWE